MKIVRYFYFIRWLWLISLSQHRVPLLLELWKLYLDMRNKSFSTLFKLLFHIFNNIQKRLRASFISYLLVLQPSNKMSWDGCCLINCVVNKKRAHRESNPGLRTRNPMHYHYAIRPNQYPQPLSSLYQNITIFKPRQNHNKLQIKVVIDYHR